MLIHLDRSAIDSAVGRSDLADRSLLCIENVLRAHQACKHIVSLRREDARALRPIVPRLSELARGALETIAGKVSEIDGLRKTVSWHLDLGLGPSFDGRAEAQGDRRIIHADLHHFADFERAGRSVLLGENLTDAELYDLLGRAFVAHRGWRHRLAFQRRGGGGSTLAADFAEAAKDGHIMLAIADSDRSHPRGGVGSTAKALNLDGRPAFQRAIVLHVRAAENLLAFELYEESLAPHRETPSLPERLMTLDRTVPRAMRDWRSYAELKQGLRLLRVQQMNPSTEEGAFWSEVSRRGHRDQCVQKRPCQAEEECACYVTEPLGPKALERAVLWMRSQKPERLANLLGLVGDAALSELCAQVAAWGLAPANRPT